MDAEQTDEWFEVTYYKPGATAPVCEIYYSETAGLKRSKRLRSDGMDLVTLTHCKVVDQ